jgi:hypothetical protein
MIPKYKNSFFEKYKKDIYSQNGEDGVVEEILNRLDINNGWVCEFGAWDGVHLSNTFSLIEKGFKGVLIEGDEVKFADLLELKKTYSNIFPIQSFVSHLKEEKGLDFLLSKTNLPKNFDVLSIDIDGFDYQVWKSLQFYQPKLVIIEINSSINPNNFSHIHTPEKYQGTGFAAMNQLGEQKGYKFLCHTGNMFFIKKELYKKLDIPNYIDLENFRRDWI